MNAEVQTPAWKSIELLSAGDSGNILRRGFNPDLALLVVQFRRKKKHDRDTEEGSIYTYQNMNQDVWDRWLAHPNVTEFFNHHIKAFPDNFPYEKVSAGS